MSQNENSPVPYPPSSAEPKPQIGAPSGLSLTEMAHQAYQNNQLWLAHAADKEHARLERLAVINRDTALAQEHMAQLQSDWWKQQGTQAQAMMDTQRQYQLTEQERVKQTFDTMLGQTRWAAFMFWTTFWLGVGLVIVSIIGYWARRDSSDQLFLVFFGGGALTMLVFFLRDPAEKIQRTGAKLVQLQVAMRYHLTEMNYWSTYLNMKSSMGQNVAADEVGRALTDMREGMQATMRQIDESMDDRTRTGMPFPSVTPPPPAKPSTSEDPARKNPA